MLLRRTFPLALCLSLAACTDAAAPGAIAAPGAEPALANQILDTDAPLHVKARVKVEELDEGEIRELTEIATQFSLDSLDLSQQSPRVEDLRLGFELSSAGGVFPCCILFIRGTAWTEGDGGGFKLEASDPQALPAVIRIIKEEDGQVVADLSGEVAAVEGRLAFNSNAKAWELMLDLSGVVTPFRRDRAHVLRDRRGGRGLAPVGPGWAVGGHPGRRGAPVLS